MRTSWEFGRTSAKWALDVNLPRFGRGTNWLGVSQGQRARQPTVSAQRLTNPREDDSVSACSAKREVGNDKPCLALLTIWARLAFQTGANTGSDRDSLRRGRLPLGSVARTIRADCRREYLPGPNVGRDAPGVVPAARGIRRYPAGEGRGGRPGFAIRDRRSRVGVRRYGSCFLLRAQELLVQLAVALQGGLQFPVVAQPLLDHGFLFGGEAELLGASAGIADGQDPDQVAGSAGADGAAGAMPDAAMEQGAAENLGGGGQSGGEFGAGFGDRRVFHA